MRSEISSTDLVRHVRTTCGKNENVVQKPAIRPIISMGVIFMHHHYSHTLTLTTIS